MSRWGPARQRWRGSLSSDLIAGGSAGRVARQPPLAGVSMPRLLAISQLLGRVHILDWIPDAAAKAAWLERYDCNGSGAVVALKKRVEGAFASVRITRRQAKCNAIRSVDRPRFRL